MENNIAVVLVVELMEQYYMLKQYSVIKNI